MDNNIARNVRIIGAVNIIIGLICFVLYGLSFYASVLGGWVGDLSIKNNLHKVVLYFGWRLSIAIIFITAFSFIKSGILALRLNQRLRKMIIINDTLMIIGLSVNIISELIESVILGIDVITGISPFDILSVVIMAMLIGEIFYLDDEKVKRQFDDAGIKAFPRKQIIYIELSYLFPSIWKLVLWLFGV